MISPGTIRIQFDADLQPLLRVPHDRGRVSYPIDRKASVKDVIEACGIPHTEIGYIAVAGKGVDFSRHVNAGDPIHAEAVRMPLDVTRPDLLRPHPLPAVRFVVDVNVGKLASLLRMLGVDTAHWNGIEDAEIARLAEAEQRVVLSRDTALLKRKQIVFGRLIRAVHPDDQLREVMQCFGLRGPFRLFSRCLRCNRPLEPVEKSAVLHRLEPKTKKYFHRFTICPDCRRVYWRGSHYDEMLARLKAAGVPV